MKYKLVALDLDGTLLDSGGQVSDKHIEAVKKAHKAGVHVVIATGRYPMQTERIIQTLDFDGIVVSNEGAITFKSKTKEIIQQYSYTVDDIAPLIDSCRRNGVHFSLTTAFEHYVEFMSPQQIDKYIQYEIQHTLHDDVMKLQEPVMKLTIDDEKRANGWQHFVPPSSIKLRADYDHFKEYVHQQSSKTNGLRKVLEYYSVHPSEVIAIGDYYNDLDMIEYAGLGIAMGNSPDEVKAKAGDVTGTNDEDGVYYALEKHLYGRS
ncbi:Cof-type HAD-IIB family hydrolase [Paenibacillus kobensis]|uniref:Cof-type HAD-IIB family hydrolase n=1 Tax=Paenibacillus kobensis TaxID=59841 RepID=UPI000FDC849C|nr:Cof-type HAD-IIB family hydrolase [Paenibacillus kobensis]